MNRHDRRVATKAAKGQTRKYKKAMGNPQDNGDVLRAIPDDLKADIARSVRSIILGGGNCFYRAVIGMELLRRLGIPTQLALGGLVYRAGPDPIRDVVSYCGPGNLGQMIGDDWVGHYWIQSGTDVIDFSVGDWRKAMSPDLMHPALPDDLGSIQWTVKPPEFFWVPETTVTPIAGQYTPEIGRAYYTGWWGPTPPVEANLRKAKATLNWSSLIRLFEARYEEYTLRERIWAAQHGHIFLDLSKFQEVAAE